MEGKLIISPEVLSALEERAIRPDDVVQTLAAAEQSGRVFVDDGGHRLAYAAVGNVTYWVEYESAVGSCTVLAAWSHRMRLLEGYNMASKALNEDTGWRCLPCDRPLVVATVKLQYMEETFAAELPSCPKCQHVFVSEEIATVKMALAERMLEDK